MKQRLLEVVLATLLLIVGVSADAADPTELALVAVTNPTPTTAARLLESNVMVVRDLERYLLVAASPADLARLDELELTWELVDARIDGKNYYTVGVGDPARLAGLEAMARVLRFDGQEAVIEANPDAAERVAARFEIARVFMRPIRTAPEEKPFGPGFLAPPDPLIQQMVDSVDGVAVDGYVQRLQDFVTRHSSTDSCAAAAQWIRDQFTMAGIDSVYFQEWSASYNDNVVAVIPGTLDPDKIVVIGGHYDSTTFTSSIAPGADDNASGTACVIEVARVLAGYPHDYTVVCVAFCGEEQGLLGSSAFVDMANQNAWNIIGAVCVDMIGYVAPGDIMDLDIIRNSSSQWLRDLVGDVAENYVPELPVVTGSLPGGASSDHASFWAGGYDAILFFEDSGDYSPYIHSDDDIVGLSYNTPELAQGSVKIAVGLTATLAKAPPFEILHTPLANTTDTQNPYRVVASIPANSTLNPDSLLVRFRTAGAWQDVPLAPTGVPDEYEAFIPAQPGGTWVDYFIVAENTDAYRLTHPDGAPDEVHTFFVGLITTILADDFESGTGWTVGDLGDNATTGIWVRADPVGSYSGSSLVQPEDDHTPDPGTICYVTGNASPGASQGTNDVDNGKTTVLSPVYDLSGLPNVWVRYYRWFTNDTGSAPETDEWTVDVSPDGGTTWVQLEATLVSQRSWTLVERNLADLIDLTTQVKFRFVARDEGSGSIVEAAIDDFELVMFEEGTSAIATAAPAPSARFELGQAAPNPFNPYTTIHFNVPEPQRPVSLRIIDVSGRLVATLLDGEPLVGAQSIRWDGRGQDGRTMASGVYFIRLDTDAQTLTGKIVLAR